MRLLLASLLLSACAAPGQLALPDPGSAGSTLGTRTRLADSAREAAVTPPRDEARDAPTAAEPPRPSASDRKIKPYRISLVRGRKRIDNVVVIEVDPTDPQRMWISKRARKLITDFLADDKHGGVDKRVPERLIWYLYLVGQQYDSEIHVLSGYRSKERSTSRHAHARAVDFRVPGVDPKQIWEALKRFDNVGLGWYPTSKFVHMDVREKSAYWIDDSGPGQRSRYRKGVPQGREKKRRTRTRG
ncbi:MAG: DUF882 domain-containing protein [bacterium]